MRKKSRKVKEVIQGRAHVNIGKNEITDSVIQEIERRLKNEGVIKVRVLKSFKKISGKDTAEIAEEVSKRVNAKLIDVRGNVFVLAKS